MPMTMETYSREQGIHRVEVPTSTSPEPTPAPPVAPAEPTTQPVEGETPPGSAPATPEAPPEPQESDGREPDVPAGQGGFQRRIKTLVTQRNSLRDENAMLRAQVAMLQQGQGQSLPTAPPQQSAPQPQQPVQRQPGEPRYEDYNGDSERYWRDLARYQARQEFEQARQAEEQARAQQDQQALSERVGARILEGQARYADFEETLHYLDASIPHQLIQEAVLPFVADSELGPAMLDYLAKHPEAIEELTERTPQGARKYLTSLESKLKPVPRQHPSPPNPQPPQPQPQGGLQGHMPPVRPLTGGNGAGYVPSSDPADIAQRGGQGSFREYVAARGYNLSRKR